MDKLRKLTTRDTGQYWEKKVESFLRRSGLITLKRNFICRSGEIDLIMKDQEYLVFTEVRFRHNPHFGSGAETVSRQKQARLIRAAMYYLASKPQYADLRCRFDVISVGIDRGQPQLRWIKHAFEAQQG